MADRDQWREQLAGRLLGEAPATPGDFSPSAATALEIAFGKARSEVTYVLEFARTHGVPATGSVIGDEVSLRRGEGVVRLRIDRREQTILAVSPNREDERLRWDGGKRTMVRADQSPIEMKAYVREAIDAVVSGYHAASAAHSPRASTVRDLPVPKSDAPPRPPPDDKK
jgi:hypothetical protein